MGTATIVVLVLTAVGVTFIGWLIRGYVKQRGDRLITCPENHQTAAVKVDAGHAAVTGLMGHTELRLSDCTRWPERQGCGQECLNQIAEAPDGCLIRNKVAGWYADKTCVLCHRPVGEREWMEHEPALMALKDPEHKTITWRDVSPETMWTVFETYAPVCWNCHVTETFRRQHPELIIDRPA